MKSILIYGPGDMMRLVRGAEAEANAFAAVNEGAAARRLHGSPLADVATTRDRRLPANLAEFDAAYPCLEDWHA